MTVPAAPEESVGQFGQMKRPKSPHHHSLPSLAPQTSPSRSSSCEAPKLRDSIAAHNDADDDESCADPVAPVDPVAVLEDLPILKIPVVREGHKERYGEEEDKNGVLDQASPLICFVFAASKYCAVLHEADSWVYQCTILCWAVFGGCANRKMRVLSMEKEEEP